MVDILAEAGVAGPSHVLLDQSRLHGPEDMQPRVPHEYVVHVHALQELLVVQDVGRHLGPRGHVVRVVEAGLVEHVAVEMAVPQRLRGEGRGGSRGLLVPVHDSRAELLEVDGEEDLPVADGVHPAAVQEVGVDLRPHARQEEKRVHRVLLGDNVHQLDLRGHLRFHADPGDLHVPVALLHLSDHGFDTRKHVGLTDALRVKRVVDEQEREQNVVVGVQSVRHVHIQEVADKVLILSGDGKDDLHPGGLRHVGHGDDLDCAQRSQQVHSLGDDLAVVFLGVRLERKVQHVLHAPRGIEAPVTVEQAPLREAKLGLVTLIQPLHRDLQYRVYIRAVGASHLALGRAVDAGVDVLFRKVFPVDHLEARSWLKGGVDANRPCDSSFALWCQLTQVVDLHLLTKTINQVYNNAKASLTAKASYKIRFLGFLSCSSVASA